MSAPQPRRRRQLAVACPWCIVVDVEWRTLAANHVEALSPEEQLRPDQVVTPFVRYRCGACGWEEIHLEAIRE